MFSSSVIYLQDFSLPVLHNIVAAQTLLRTHGVGEKQVGSAKVRTDDNIGRRRGQQAWKGQIWGEGDGAVALSTAEVACGRDPDLDSTKSKAAAASMADLPRLAASISGHDSCG